MYGMVWYVQWPHCTGMVCHGNTRPAPISEPQADLAMIWPVSGCPEPYAPEIRSKSSDATYEMLLSRIAGRKRALIVLIEKRIICNR